MSRWIALLGVSALSCAVGSTAKMSWPQDLVDVAAAETAVGGGLETRPMRSAVHRIVHHNTDAALLPGASREGRSYLLLHWPLPATGVTSLFGKRADPIDGIERNHTGVDLEASYGAVVNAAADGVVVWAGWNSGHGRQVIIEHVGGFRSGYSHLSQILTFVGNSIRTGDPVGLVGNSGRSTGPHLHFELTQNDVYLDPLDVLGVPQPLD